MNATPLSFNQHIMEALKPYCLATADELGVVLIDPVKPAPPLKLVYSSYDEISGSWRATLSFKQHSQLAALLRRTLNTNASFLDLNVDAMPTSLFVCFTIHPSTLHGDLIAPCNHPGLGILFVSGQRVSFMWEVSKSNVTWPSWVERPAF